MIRFTAESAVESLDLDVHSACMLLQRLGLEPQEYGVIDPRELMDRVCAALNCLRELKWSASWDSYFHLIRLFRICYAAEIAKERVTWW